jgi:type II secretory pathway component PulK
MRIAKNASSKKGIALLVALTLSILLSLIAGAILAGAIALRELTSNPLDTILKRYLVEIGQQDAIIRLRTGTLASSSYQFNITISGKTYTVHVDVAAVTGIPGTYQITVTA